MATFSFRVTLLLGTVCILLGAPLPAFAQRIGLLDTRTAAYFQFGSPTYTVLEDQLEAVITVVRTGEDREAVSVDYATADGTAHNPKDYFATSGTLNFPGGIGIATFRVAVRSDTSAQGPRTVRLTLSNPGFNGLIIDGEATLTIQAAAEASATPAVILAVRVASPGGVLISWPASGVPCVLERSVEASVDAWVQVTQVPQVFDGQCTVSEPASAPRSFYRLKAR